MDVTGLPIVTVGEQRASSFAAHPLTGNLASEPREQFRANLCDEAERDIRQALAAGAARMSIDFHRGSLIQQERPSQPWTGHMLDFFVKLSICMPPNR